MADDRKQSGRGAWRCLVTLNEAAELAGVKRTVVEAWARAGRLRVDRGGNVILVDPAPLPQLAAAYRDRMARYGTRKRPAVRVCRRGLEPDPADGPDPIEVVARCPHLLTPGMRAEVDRRRAGLLALSGGTG